MTRNSAETRGHLQPAADAGLVKAADSTSAQQFAYVDPDLSWEDLAWIKKMAPGKPIIIKGIQAVEVSSPYGRALTRGGHADALLDRTQNWRSNMAAKASS